MKDPQWLEKALQAKRLIERSQQMIDPPPGEIIFCYSLWQPLYEELSNQRILNLQTPIKFVEGLPDIKHIPKDMRPRLIIVDDSYTDSMSSPQIADLYTKHSHHLNISIILICQIMFGKEKTFPHHFFKYTLYVYF